MSSPANNSQIITQADFQANTVLEQAAKVQANSALIQNEQKSPISSSLIPFDIPIIALFSYLNDCQVKIPVSIREKDGLYYMKNPVKPNSEWKLNLIIRGIDFPEGQIIRLMRNPFGEVDVWESSLIRKAAHSEFAEIYQISEPRYSPIIPTRKAPRVFCLSPVKCIIGNIPTAIPATCVDLSETGMGLRFDHGPGCKIGDSCLVNFFPPLENLPGLVGKVLRQSTNAIDKSTSVGIFLDPSQKEIIVKIIDFMVQKQASQNSDSFLHIPTNDNQASGSNQNRGFLSDLTKSFPPELFNLFNSGNKA